ncbi:SWIM zinc finger domain protein [Nitzschia inconspicua]|uniref:SWIM zinc finger domain protein n=1 Tax=Nitzschia inconspicua TaxID=303405 RepID=A0A9K3L9N5_9STRA|nr:SWIM zinc finger domain protein [Nitzschia inconspicua]
MVWWVVSWGWPRNVGRNASDAECTHPAMTSKLIPCTRSLGGELEEEALLKVRPVDCVCDCGKWQAIGVPCAHGMAYFRHQMKWSLEDVLDQAVDEYYKYMTQRELYRRNFVPVWRHLLEPDMMTLPPDGAVRRMPGRPKTVRLRKNSRYAHEPEKLPTICSRCRQPGHNARVQYRFPALISLMGSVSSKHPIDASNTVLKDPHDSFGNLI